MPGWRSWWTPLACRETERKRVLELWRFAYMILRHICVSPLLCIFFFWCGIYDLFIAGSALQSERASRSSTTWRASVTELGPERIYVRLGAVHCTRLSACHAKRTMRVPRVGFVCVLRSSDKKLDTEGSNLHDWYGNNHLLGTGKLRSREPWSPSLIMSLALGSVGLTAQYLIVLRNLKKCEPFRLRLNNWTLTKIL